jgi:hypothetical protein
VMHGLLVYFTPFRGWVLIGVEGKAPAFLGGGEVVHSHITASSSCRNGIGEDAVGTLLVGLGEYYAESPGD